MVTPGHFKLYDAAAPPLVAGDYDLVGNQELTGNNIPANPTAELRSRVRVRSVRYKLPPDQILSVWPAANDEGAFESRLPQIVIRRRTLPWERRPGDLDDEETPWLALVVIAEGEGVISPERPIAECVTPGVTLSGPSDSPTGVYLGVTKTVIDKVFPTKDDLRYLTHVREVDIADTELALGDDDGFMAVVLANRLPQFDRVGCKPVRYTACLVNLEDQLDVLPPPQPPSPLFEYAANVQDLRVAVEGAPSPADPGESDLDAARRVRRVGERVARVAPTRTKAEAAWSTTTRAIEHTALTAGDADVAVEVRSAMRRGFSLPVERIAELLQEPIHRFPVLAHWSFTCTGSGSFETLMANLDVGLLGTVAADKADARRLDCLPDTDAEGPPPTPAPRPATEFTETGHVGLAHRSRRGDPLRAWYRGPLGPHVTKRGEALAHVSDHLRGVTPDGREDLTYAAAFEIGRLLALSQPSVVAALLRWRQERFGAARARGKAGLGIGDRWEIPAEVASVELGRLLGRQIVLRAAAEPDAVLGPTRPLVDPGRPLDGIDRPLEEVLAEGFQLPADTVRRLLEEPLTGAVLEGVDPAFTGVEERFTRDDGLVLRDALTREVDALADDVARTRRRPRG